MSGHALRCVPLLALLFSTTADGQQRSITLREAVTRALASHPDARAADADVAIARGELTSARVRAPNPGFAAEFGPATNRDTSLRSVRFGLSQTVELGGKRRYRSSGAGFRLEAAESRRTRLRAVIAWRAQRAFFLALVARDRLATAAEADTVGLALLTAAQDRLQLGSGTQLEVNVAAAAHARDRRTRLDAERQLATAQFELRAAIGAAISDSLIAEGDLPKFALASASVESVLAESLRRRPDFAAVRAERNAAEAGQGLARSLIWPDPGIGVSSGRAEDFNVTVFSISLPFPVWNRNQGATAAASASLDRARVAEDSARRAVELEVRDAHQALARAIASRDAFEVQVIDRLTENLSLARESFQAGKISLFTYNIIRRDLVESRLAYLDAMAETVERRYALALATGEPWE